MALLLSALVGTLLIAPTLSPVGSSYDHWARLRRPLHLPTRAAGTPCPVSGLGQEDFARYGVADGIGPGPAYPIGMQPGSVLQFRYPPARNTVFAGSAWSGQKVLWFVSPTYRGPVLIRGGRLGSSARLRFDFGLVPSKELRIPTNLQGGNPAGTDLVGQRYRPSYTRLRSPGCYAYQVDGTTFSREIVFRAVKRDGA